jgi:hypothetical protein
MSKARKSFTICIDNTDYEASLILRKLYEVIPDEKAEQDDFLRVIDESDEDYLYHRSHFLLIKLPVEVEAILSTV